MAREPGPKAYDQSPFASPNILRAPDIEDTLKNLEIVRLGDIALATVNWGKFEDKSAFIHRNMQAGRLKTSEPKTGILLDMIEKSGFGGGYRSAPDVDGRSDQQQEMHAQIGAFLAKKVIQARGWNGIDVLTIGSISSRIDTAERTAEILRKEGISVGNALFIGFACAGASTQLGDLNRIRDLKGARVVVEGIESLSGKQFDESDIQTSWTFGDGGGAMAFRAGEDIKHHAGKTWVQIDNGMITIPHPPIYTLPDADDILPPEQWHPWYNFVNEESRKAFAFSKGGIVMQMSATEGQDLTKMEPQKTYKFFGKTVPVHMAEFFQKNQYDESELGPVIIHHPAKPVQDGIVGLYEKERERLAKQNIFIPRFDIEWMLSEAGVNNVSAAVTLFVIKEMIKKNKIPFGKKIPLIGLGIGSVEHIEILEFVQP